MRTDQINVILLIALISWGTAQILKTLIHFIKTKNFKAERLTGAGGMPSAHSATVCATAITTCRVCGICSPEFALAMILAMVVMYDAMGVRRFMDKFDDKVDEIEEKKPEEIHELKEFLGHTPLEVLCGALLGILIAMAVPIQVVG